jgi:two-component system chemotaxis response regulator CheY
MTTKSSTVLIIDDDADIRELLRIVLEGEGYPVNLAADGLDALEQLKAGARPALILLDLMTPGMDSEDFLKRLREGPCAKTPVVIMSGHNAAQKTSKELKAACCLTKPVEFEELLKTVKRFMPVRAKR